MAIVQIKKLRLLAIRSQQEDILRELMLLGCVEVTEQASDPEQASGLMLPGKETTQLSGYSSALDSFTHAIRVLDKYAPKKSGLFSLRPELSVKELLNDSSLADAQASVNKIEYLDLRIQRVQVMAGQERALIESLTPWEPLDIPLLGAETRTCMTVMGAVPAATELGQLEDALYQAVPECQLLKVASDKNQHYLALICMRDEQRAALTALREYGFTAAVFQSESGTAKNGIAQAQLRLAGLEQTGAELIKDLKEEASCRDLLKRCADNLATKVMRAEAAERLSCSDSVFALEGWMISPAQEKLGESLAKYDCAWELSDPTPEEYKDVPIRLNNNKVTDPLNMVTEMYSLPAYGSVDPNPLIAPFFILFFGLMMADMGYGVLMIIMSIIVKKKARPRGTMRHMFNLMLLCGISTIIIGALTGSFFGDAPLQFAQMMNPDTTWQGLPALFSPLDDAILVLVGSLALGLIQIFTGMCISFIKQAKRGETMAALCNEGAWFLVFVLLGVAVITGMWKYCLIAIAVLLVLTQGYGRKGIKGKLVGIGGSLYNNLTGYFSDILSYSRIMALMLAGAVIAQVFNTLGAVTGNMFAFFVIALIGNTLNFGLNLLSCFVHDLRLQCLEFFGRFYEDGGRALKPLKITSTYFDIVKD